MVLEGHLVSVFRLSRMQRSRMVAVGTASFVGANDYVPKGSGSVRSVETTSRLKTVSLFGTRPPAPPRWRARLLRSKVRRPFSVARGDFQGAKGDGTISGARLPSQPAPTFTWT